MDFRRILLWVVIGMSMASIWTNWRAYTDPNYAQAHLQTQQAVPVAGTDAAAPQNVPTTPELKGELVDVKTDFFDLKFSTQGAQLVYAKLLQHQGLEDNHLQLVLLNHTPDHFYVAQMGLIGAHQQAYPDQNTMFHLVSKDLTMKGNTLDVVFEAESGGLKVVRTYTLHKDSYEINVSDRITNVSTEPQMPYQYYQITRDTKAPPAISRFSHSESYVATYSEADKFQEMTFKDIEDGSAKYAKTAKKGWIAYIQHYFVTAWVPPQQDERQISVRPLFGGKKYVAITSTGSLGTIAPQQTIQTSSKLWVGPQDQNALAKVQPTLSVVVNYGWVTILAKPMFAFMTWLYSIIGNWGWTIIALTVLIKLILFPLSAAGYKSMAKMKRISPRIQALREQYKDDRQGLNNAMMEMYRTEKINPMGGCFPILIQIPVFLTLYRVISSSVELRGAPWIGWIHDLSALDPYYILPGLMLISMLVQYKLNPTPADPMQARMMMIMPFLFGVFMFFFPSGLVLYWLVNNVLSIIQQAYISRRYNEAANEAILTHR